MNNSIKKARKSNYLGLVICALGIMINLLLRTAVSFFDLPIFLDSVGTIAVAVMCGYLPGILVGFFTMIIKSISDSSLIYYGITDILIALVAAWFAKTGRTKSVSGVLTMIAALALIGGGIDLLIPWLIDGLESKSEVLSNAIYAKGFFSIGSSKIASNLILNFADKSVSAFVGLIIVNLVPKKVFRHFDFNWWLQTPVPNQDLTKDEKNRVISLRVKTVLMLAVSMTTVAVVAMWICMNVYHEAHVKEFAEVAQSMAKLAASDVNGDLIDTYLENEGAAEGYSETQKRLESILQNSPDIEYLYVFQFREDGCHVVFDVDTEKEKAFEIGTVVPYDNELKEHLPNLLSGEEIEPIITNDRYGRLLTYYQPVSNSNGERVCFVGADVDMEQLIIDERSFLVKMISIFLSSFILICGIGIWIIRYHIIYPVKTITKYVDGFSSEGATQEELDDFIKIFRALDIHTGDEIEKLYNALCRMTLNQAEQTRSIRRLSDATTKMQDGLIITMADLVESRDSDTGAHVQKTAAYVKIIAEGLKKKSYYAEKITPKFLSDVVRSAPLHDIGKINIPDEILNKPGKLTDEEYEIMKTHATAGKKIMEHAIGTVEGDSYLKEARNMAAYHHERWDGKGYPEGLHGNVIPLSARIMAVADVFDALASPRVYKPAFPLEKALAIIEEGKGTQFDPKCVEVFMDSLPEVKEVLRKYQNN